jgi:hypothetical protein
MNGTKGYMIHRDRAPRALISKMLLIAMSAILILAVLHAATSPARRVISPPLDAYDRPTIFERQSLAPPLTFSAHARALSAYDLRRSIARLVLGSHEQP